MDYKKILKSRAVRLAILKALCFIPDKPMLKLQYRIKTGRKLNLKAPQRFTEKLQWYKLYYRDPLMVQCADKAEVRAYVEEIGLGSILNECYGVFDAVEQIDFSELPQKFVLKDTLGSGGNSVIIVEDKETADFKTVKEQMEKWVEGSHKIKGGGREWPYYSGKKHRIIAERFIPSEAEKGGLIDYKFFCFNGKAEYLYVIADRELGGTSSFGIFDRDFNLLPYQRVGAAPLNREISKPANYERMRAVAEQLAAAFPHARIDLYNQNEDILFGEITFYGASGYMLYDPDMFDFELGKKFVLPEKKI